VLLLVLVLTDSIALSRRKISSCSRCSVPVLPRCLAKAAAHAEWMLFTQFSSSTWHGACNTHNTHIQNPNQLRLARRRSFIQFACARRGAKIASPRVRVLLLPGGCEIGARAFNWRETQAATAAPMACLLFEIGLPFKDLLFVYFCPFLVFGLFKYRLGMLKIRVQLACVA
jgi:hypothetical protein